MISVLFSKFTRAWLILQMGSNIVFAQETDTIKPVLNFSGAVSVTNNGFSFIPSFSLGKPAAIFNFNVNAGKRFSFEPEFRFSLLDAKPWSFIFIWRYKLVNQPHFQLTAGGHLPAIPFRTVTYVKNGVPYETLANYRFLPFELSPNWRLNAKTNLSLFYLYAYGFGDATRHTHFLALRANFTQISLSKSVFLRVMPQAFYLKLDKIDGFYAALNATVSHKKSPFSVSFMANRPIKSSIAGKKFDWNVGLGYALNRRYVRN